MLVLHLQIQITGCYRTEANPTKTLHLDPSPSQHTDIPTHINVQVSSKKPEVFVCASASVSLCVCA